MVSVWKWISLLEYRWNHLNTGVHWSWCWSDDLWLSILSYFLSASHYSKDDTGLYIGSSVRGTLDRPSEVLFHSIRQSWQNILFWRTNMIQHIIIYIYTYIYKYIYIIIYIIIYIYIYISVSYYLVNSPYLRLICLTQSTGFLFEPE